MTTIDMLIASYTGYDSDLRTQTAAAPHPPELRWRTAHNLQRTEDELRQHVQILHETATNIDASPDSEPGPAGARTQPARGTPKATATASTC
jgi:hypothetical protein